MATCYSFDSRSSHQRNANERACGHGENRVPVDFNPSHHHSSPANDFLNRNAIDYLAPFLPASPGRPLASSSWNEDIEGAIENWGIARSDVSLDLGKLISVARLLFRRLLFRSMVVQLWAATFRGRTPPTRSLWFTGEFP